MEEKEKSAVDAYAKQQYISDYRISLNLLKLKKQDIVINKPDVMNVFCRNLFFDAEAMMEYIDKQTDQEHSLKSFQKRR